MSLHVHVERSKLSATVTYSSLTSHEAEIILYHEQLGLPQGIAQTIKHEHSPTKKSQAQSGLAPHQTLPLINEEHECKSLQHEIMWRSK